MASFIWLQAHSDPSCIAQANAADWRIAWRKGLKDPIAFFAIIRYKLIRGLEVGIDVRNSIRAHFVKNCHAEVRTLLIWLDAMMVATSHIYIETAYSISLRFSIAPSTCFSHPWAWSSASCRNQMIQLSCFIETQLRFWRIVFKLCYGQILLWWNSRARVDEGISKNIPHHKLCTCKPHNLRGVTVAMDTNSLEFIIVISFHVVDMMGKSIFAEDWQKL